MVLAHNLSIKRTEDIKINNEVTFQTMMLSKPILDGLTSAGFYKPSPIQLLGIPLGKLGIDLILEAKSGTGKTIVFTTIALEKLNLNKGLQVLIVTPTREIAAQIYDVLQQIGTHIQGLNVQMIIGGLPFKEDLEKLKNNVHILVATPGRLADLIKEKHITTSEIHLLILDEADKLMEKSFKADIKYIHSALPREKQIILSSATYPVSVAKVVNTLVRNPHHVCPDTSKILLGVSHRVTLVKCNSNSVRQTEIRFNELTKILSETEFKQCVIFCKYQARVTQLHKLLTKAKWPAELVYGKQKQTIRLEALKTLQEYKCRILISTDLLSRGIDSKNVDLVVNFEPPDTCETYLHRIGRSGRYGSIGMAISIVCEGEELNNYNQILEPIMHTIDMKLFWTGEKLNNSQCSHQNYDEMIITKDESRPNTLVESDSNVNIHCSETLWESLSYTPRVENIENFDQLCNSFNSAISTAKIKSYDEMIITKDESKPNTFAESDSIVNNCCETLWKTLSYTPKVKNIENFDQLCNSFNSAISTPKIESFSDLVEDFAKMKNILHNEYENSIYRKMEFEDISYQNSFDYIKKLKDKLNKCSSSKNENRLKDEDCIPENCVKNYNNSCSNIGNEPIVSRLVNENLDRSVNDLLELPKAFSSRKFNTRNIVQTNKRQKAAYKNTKIVYDLNKYDNTDTAQGNIQSKTNYPKTNHKFTNIRKPSNAYSEAQEHKSEYMKKEQEYNKWYCQLKTRMNQIEQMFYIEEMSK